MSPKNTHLTSYTLYFVDTTVTTAGIFNNLLHILAVKNRLVSRFDVFETISPLSTYDY